MMDYNTNMKNINWYPGHMKKTRELIEENLKMVDLVIEVVDARIPVSSRNPIIDDLIKGKRRVIALNKSDLADSRASEQWIKHFKGEGYDALAMDCAKGSGVNQMFKLLTAIQEEKDKERMRKKPLRMMIVGVPNVGKSSLINRMTGKKSAQTGDRPGVTRGKQWLRLQNGMQLLDTPGILWPKFEDEKVGLLLAVTGAIRDDILPLEEIAYWAMGWLQAHYPEVLKERYDVELCENPYDTLLAIAAKRGYRNGSNIDEKRMIIAFLREIRDCKIGAITWELADEN